MIVGIVGSEGAKFTPETEAAARSEITRLLSRPGVTAVCSGGCHLGGVDIFAEEEAAKLGLEAVVFKPKRLTWSGGYKERNLQIADASDEVHCITVKTLPAGYRGMRFRLCYHCGAADHIKSGGCWTVKMAKKAGKPTSVIVV